MMILLNLILVLFAGIQQAPSSIFSCRDVSATIFSSAPVENIEARSTKGYSVLNCSTGEVQFNIPVASFHFEKSLMQEHFNENYMESDKYPSAQFKGKINEKIDPAREGEYPVTVTGDLTVHGVKKTRTITGKITVDKTGITVSSVFDVACKDHQIKIPSIVFKNIAEVIKVTISAKYTPYTSQK